MTEAQGTQQDQNTIQASLDHSDLASAENGKQSNKDKSKGNSKQQSRVTSSKVPMDHNDSESKVKAEMMTRETGDLTPYAVDGRGISIVDATKVTTKDGKQIPQEGLLGNPPDYGDSEPLQDYDDIENMLGRSFDQID